MKDVVIADKLTSFLTFLLLCGPPELRKGTTLLLYIGNEIGMALASDGKNILSRRNHGGELGHTLADPNGELCVCGRRGCLETVATCDALFKRIAEKSHTVLNLSTAEKELLSENRVVLEEVAKTTFHLGAAVADRINTLFPDHVVFSGPMNQLGEPFRQMLLTEIRQRLFPLSSSPLSFHFYHESTDDETSCATGAALMAGDRILSDFALFDQHCPVRSPKLKCREKCL